jgi:hypothetical protein
MKMMIINSHKFLINPLNHATFLLTESVVMYKDIDYTKNKLL